MVTAHLELVYNQHEIESLQGRADLIGIFRAVLPKNSHC